MAWLFMLLMAGVLFLFTHVFCSATESLDDLSLRDESAHTNGAIVYSMALLFALNTAMIIAGTVAIVRFA